jgi:hypothetical protein
MADYTYQPIYGVEPWQDNAGVGYPAVYGGGAKYTAQNLLVSMWTTIDPFPTLDKLLVSLPNTADAVALNAVIPGLGTYGVAQVFNSRTSTRFILQLDDEAIPNDCIAILNPPSDYKSQLQNALKTNANSPVGFEVLKSFLGSQAFEYYVTNGKSEALPGGAIFGNPLGFGLIYANSGADGTPPTLLPDYTAGFPAFQTTINALNSGNFYLGVTFSPGGDEDTGVFTINWPHTAARG